MKVKAVQSFAGPEGPVEPGDVVEIDDDQGAFLIRHGFAKAHGCPVASGRQRAPSRGRRASPSVPPESRSEDATDQNEDDGAGGKA